MAIREEMCACLEIISESYWGLSSSPIQKDKWGLKMKETQLMSSNPPAALRWGDGRVLEQTNSFLSWKQQVVAETKKSYEKLATLRKDFGHSGSYKSEDGTLYIGIVCFLCWGNTKLAITDLDISGDFDSGGVRTGLGHLEVRYQDICQVSRW